MVWDKTLIVNSEAKVVDVSSRRVNYPFQVGVSISSGGVSDGKREEKFCHVEVATPYMRWIIVSFLL